jgi:Lsr2
VSNVKITASHECASTRVTALASCSCPVCCAPAPSPLIRQIVDDLDQTELAEAAAERVEFSFRGVSYHLELIAANAAKFEKALAPYMKAAADASPVEPQGRSGRTRTRSSTRRKRSATKASPKEDTAAIRAWANDNGYSVSPRGRIRAEIVEAFHAARLNQVDADPASTHCAPAVVPAGRRASVGAPGWS